MGEHVVDVVPGRTNPGAVLSAVGIVSNSVTQTSVLTVPAGRTWVGTVTAIATSTATVASAQNVRAITAGTNVAPAVGAVLAVATGGRDTTSTVQATPGVTISAPAGNAVTVDLVNSTATTFTGTVFCYGLLQ